MSLSKKSRFVRKTEKEMEIIMRGYVPENTEKNTSWARKCFSEWVFQRNENFPDEKCPEDILERQDVDEIGKWFPTFITEVRRSDGQPYPPRSIHQILSGLLRYMRAIVLIFWINGSTVSNYSENL